MIQKVTKYKYEGIAYDSFSQLKQAYPYISFPAGAADDVLLTLGIEKVDEYPPLERCKDIMRTQAGMLFAHKRDAIRWVEFGSKKYGFDCASEDITNFMAAYTPLFVVGKGTVFYKVWLSETEKGIVEITAEEMTNVYNAVRTGQMEAYVWYDKTKKGINAAETVEELNKIELVEELNV